MTSYNLIKVAYSKKVSEEVLEKHKADFKFPVYACDDDSALKIVNGSIEVVSEGEFVVINK